MADTVEKRGYPWRLFFLLLAAAVLSALAVVPYVKAMLGPMLASKPLPLPLPLLVLIQGTINFAVAIGLGLLLARKVGLGAPILEGALYRTAYSVSARMIWISCLTGLSLGALILAIAHMPFAAALSKLPGGSEKMMPWPARLLACFYGGLGEEMLARLFLLSLFIWLIGKCVRATNPGRSAAIFWPANLLAALLFGAGHLPFAAQLTPLNAELITVVIALNALVALAFGYLYWKFGLEAAMLSHFSADIALHVIGPLL